MTSLSVECDEYIVERTASFTKRDWGVPVFYLRVADGHLFSAATDEAVRRDDVRAAAQARSMYGWAVGLPFASAGFNR
jgi:hypothetical protein